MGLFNYKQYTVSQLLNIDDGRVSRSSGLKVKLVDNFVIATELGFLKNLIRRLLGRPKEVSTVLKYRVDSDSGSTYTVLINIPMHTNKRILLNSYIKVFCSCSDFMYRAAWVLNKTNNLYKNKATLDHLKVALSIEPTKVTTTPICKHIYACLLDVKVNLDRYVLI